MFCSVKWRKLLSRCWIRWSQEMNMCLGIYSNCWEWIVSKYRHNWSTTFMKLESVPGTTLKLWLSLTSIIKLRISTNIKHRTKIVARIPRRRIERKLVGMLGEHPFGSSRVKWTRGNNWDVENNIRRTEGLRACFIQDAAERTPLFEKRINSKSKTIR